MTIEALITGRLHKRAEERTGRTGRPFVVATARVAAGEAQATFVNVVAFSESACAALLALSEGDSVALAGTLTPKAWIDREGAAHPSLDMVATQEITLYVLKKKREASRPTAPAETAPAAQQRQPEPEDFGPPGWPEEGR